MLLFFELLLLAYLIVAIVTVSIVLTVVDSKIFRSVFAALGLVMPLIFIYSATTSLFARRTCPRFNDEFAGVEDEIESERVRIFGGEKICPSFGHRWQEAYQRYLESVVERAAQTSEKIAEFSAHAVGYF